jgi:hypothetical protein
MRRSAGWAGLAAGFAGLCALVVGSPAAAEPVPIGTVGLTPNHGRATAPISATYHLVGLQSHCPARSDFAFDNKPVGSAPAVATDKACLYTLRFVPPAGTFGGNHYVSAKASDGVHAASALYVVEGSASPSATPSPKPTPTAASPTPSRSRATPSATVSTSDPAPAIADSASTDTGAAAGARHVAPPSRSAPWMTWVLAFGAVLVLGGLAMLGLLLYYNRRPADPADPGGEAPTQEFPRPAM